MFNSKFYLDYYPDLNKNGIVTHDQALKHWKNHGKKENRICSNSQLFSKYFDKFYKTTNISVIELDHIHKFKNNYQNIYENINNLITIIKSCNYFNNILIISGDYPGYGGAATNSLRLRSFFSEKGFETKCLFFSYEKHNIDTNEFQDCYFAESTDDSANDSANDSADLFCQLKKLKYKYNLVILKSPVSGEVLNYFKENNILILFFISGIFTNELDRPYNELNKVHDASIKSFDASIQSFDQYINKGVIEQIKIADFSFVNSYHVAEILKNVYKLNTFLFYSSFIQYCGENNVKESIHFESNQFENRSIDYAVIISNFDRKIKNVSSSISYLKKLNMHNDFNIYLIGMNSDKYKEDGFKCLGLQSESEMKKLYKSIKYIVDSSYFESANNVRIESIMNGCKYIYLN
jgi:hypothetical protein